MSHRLAIRTARHALLRLTAQLQADAAKHPTFSPEEVEWMDAAAARIWRPAAEEQRYQEASEKLRRHYAEGGN